MPLTPSKPSCVEVKVTSTGYPCADQRERRKREGEGERKGREGQVGERMMNRIIKTMLQSYE